MNFRTALLPCSLLLFGCSQLPQDLSNETSQEASTSEEIVAATSLPEVRYYLIADT